MSPSPICVCWLLESIRKSWPTIPFYQHFHRLGHIHPVLISNFILFMRTGIHCLTQDLFSLLLNCCLSCSSVFSLCHSFFFCWRSFIFFCSSSAFSIYFFSLRLLTISLFLYFLFLSFSLSWFRLLSFCSPIFPHSIVFVFSCVLSRAKFSFSLSLYFLDSSLTFSFLFIWLFLIHFLFLLFFVRLAFLVLMVLVALYSFRFLLSHHFRILLLFFSLFPFFRIPLPLAFSQTCFFCFLSLLSTFFYSLFYCVLFVFLNLFALRLLIYFCFYRSLFLSLFISHSICFDFLMLCENVYYS